MDGLTSCRARAAAIGVCLACAIATSASAQPAATPYGATGTADDTHALRDGATAAEIAREVGEGLQATEQASPQRPARAASGPARAAPGGRAAVSDDPTGIRERSKALLRWIKSHLPGAREDEDEIVVPVRDDPRMSTWAEPRLDGDRRRGTPLGEGSRGEGYASPYPAQRSPGSDGAGSSMRTAEDDPIQRVAAVVRLIVGHPMTWLIVVLIAVGAYAVKKFDRRPK